MIPNSASLQEALLLVLRENPVGLSSKEIDRLVALKLGLTNQDLEVMRSGKRSEFAYRMAWERTHAKAKGLISKGPKRTWNISESGNQNRAN